MLPFLEKRRIQVEEELQELIQNRSLAGIGTEDEYQLKIDKLKKERHRLQAEIEEEKSKIKTPKETKIFFYVLVSTNEKVRAHTGDSCHCLFHSDCYHDVEYHQWKPFSDNPIIIELLQCVVDTYNVQPIYLDGEIDKDHWLNLDEHIDNSVAIIDLFSLDSINKHIAQKFDTKKAGVLMPLCRTLDKKLVAFAHQIANEFKVLKAYRDKSVPCECYVSDIAGVGAFKQQLLRIFKEKFPIKNQVKTESPVRGINIGIQ